MRGSELVVAVTHTGLTVSREVAREIPELDAELVSNGFVPMQYSGVHT